MATSVKLSKETIEVLKVISNINNSLRFESGSELKTMSNDQTIVMEATVAETFPQTFSIYDLSQFLSVLALPNMQDAELVFDGDKKVLIKSGKSKIDYYFTEASFVTYPAGKKIILPSVDLAFEITQEYLTTLSKGAATLGHKLVEFRAEEGKVYMIATTPDLDTSNNMVIELGDTDAEDGKYIVSLDRFKLLPGDYKVEICAAGMLKMEHVSRPVTTFIGLEAQ
ncbi:hypothetical protein [Ralstonia phage RSP15]|uniref:DNA polymerase processivity factor n=1 Tax=Ralstonia phage RSP15 TaxID=1785960 RepID=UPI00074D443A|nr:DNA polymerase processivity factor [Ralstonia phage RSP15]BAU40087.1 hypothetical protein [Ralstonia phage RSP15]